MRKILITCLFYCLIPSFFSQEKIAFAFHTTYNNSEYTNPTTVATLEKAIQNPDSIIAVKIAANSKKLTEISKLKNLKYIYLDETFTSVSFYLTAEKMELFFQQLSELSNLSYLSIYDSQLLKYNKYLTKLKGLKINKLESFSLHENLLALKELEVLIIQDPFVNYIPATIGQLSSLKQLELYTTDVLYFPNLNELKQLTVLKIAIGKIDKLNESVAQLKNVQFLSINGLTNFKTFPEEICRLSNLQELHIELRNAQPLPDCIGLLSNLRVLHLYDCQKIYEFPSSFANLSKLNEIYLGDAPEHIQLTNLAILPLPFTLILNRCNYLGIAKQLNTIPKLKQLIVPTTILPKELKKLQEAIMAEKVIVQQL